MKVKTKDMDKAIHTKVTALGMVGIKVDYPTMELILNVLNHVDGSFTLDQASQMSFDHNEKWQKYEIQNKEG